MEASDAPQEQEPGQTAVLPSWPRVTAFYNGHFCQTAVQFVVETILTVLLLACLQVVHWVLNKCSVSNEFKSWFSRAHELVAFGSFLLLAIKGLLRLGMGLKGKT